MNQEADDYQSDIQFGKWLKDQRNTAGYTLERVSKETLISPQRLKSLETGFSERSITRSESEKLSNLYKISLRDFLQKAGEAPILKPSDHEES